MSATLIVTLLMLTANAQASPHSASASHDDSNVIVKLTSNGNTIVTITYDPSVQMLDADPGTGSGSASATMTGAGQVCADAACTIVLYTFAPTNLSTTNGPVVGAGAIETPAFAVSVGNPIYYDSGLVLTASASSTDSPTASASARSESLGLTNTGPGNLTLTTEGPRTITLDADVVGEAPPKRTGDALAQTEDAGGTPIISASSDGDPAHVLHIRVLEPAIGSLRPPRHPARAHVVAGR